VWVGNDDKRNSLGKKETGARAALPIWLEFMQDATKDAPLQSFPNVIPLEQLAGGKELQVDTADTAPPTDAAEQGLTEAKAPEKPTSSAIPSKPSDKAAVPAPSTKPPAPSPQKISVPVASRGYGRHVTLAH
jgi:penicillin-binding protein 1A